MIRTIVLLVWPPAWGFSIAALTTALERITEIRRYNSEHGTSESGILSASLCAVLGLIAIITPPLLLGLMYGLMYLTPAWLPDAYGAAGW